MKHRKSQSAIDSWISLLGRERVIAAEEGLEPYRQNTSGLDRTFPAVIKPETTGEVQEVVRIARRTIRLLAARSNP